MSQYIVINNSDGDTFVKSYSKEELLAILNDEDWNSYGKMSEIPDHADTNYWGDNIIIIKGEVVVPTAVTTVTEFNIK